LAEARPLAFKPPFGFFPSFLCHAGDFAMIKPELPSSSNEPELFHLLH
jgi:hypothetical protein